MTKALNTASRTRDTVVGIYLAASMKWGAIFAALAFLACLFFRRKDSALHFGWLLAIASLWGLAGLYQHLFIEWGFGLMGLSIFVIGLLLLFSPRKLRMR